MRATFYLTAGKKEDFYLTSQECLPPKEIIASKRISWRLHSCMCKGKVDDAIFKVVTLGHASSTKKRSRSPSTPLGFSPHSKKS